MQRVRRFHLVVLLGACLAGSLAASGDYTVSHLTLGGSFAWPAYPYFNGANQVAGTSTTPGDAAFHGFFHDGSTLHDLGTLGGTTSIANSFNDAGQVVGEANTAGDTASHAFLWTQAAGMTDLGTLGGTNSAGVGINNTGQVVGFASTSGNAASHAFFWTPSTGMIDIGTLGGSHSFPQSITDAGQVVGSAATVGGASHAFVWTQDAGMIDLGTLGGSDSWPYLVNDAGQVVGTSYIGSGGIYHAFSWTPSTGMIDLGTLGGSYSTPYGINDAGEVVGNAHIPGDVAAHAFVWTQANGMVDLGTLGGTHSQAVTINNAGQVLGVANTVGDAGNHAFFWAHATGMIDLGTLGGSFSYPAGIDDQGQVIGWSFTAGDASLRAFVWTQAEGMVDLNDRITSTAPPGLVLDSALAISQDGWIISASNAGLMLLGAASRAPLLGPIAANDPVASGTPVSVSALFTDPDIAVTHTAVWHWGDGSAAEPGTVSESDGSGMISGAHTFLAAGVYHVGLDVTDSTGQDAHVTRDVVVYDSSAGFVTGNGWINSPPGAYTANRFLTGRATFAFVSMYKKRTTQPLGSTEFRFQTADLNFNSRRYDWLVVGGARAQFKGTGTINGSGSYSFMLTVVDGDINGGGGVDRFRIKIWYYDAQLKKDVVVYDNQTSSGTEGTVRDGSTLGGGTIIIHN